MAKLKAGDKFIFNKCGYNAQLEENHTDMYIGKIYTVYKEEGVKMFNDSNGDQRSLEDYIGKQSDSNYGYKVTKIVD